LNKLVFILVKKNSIFSKSPLLNFLKKLERPLTFFGKILGSQRDYYVATLPATEDEEA